MDIKKISENKDAKKSRSLRPVRAFHDLYTSSNLALEEVYTFNVSQSTKETLLKNHIINLVTAIEIYYKDMLDAIFRLCKPSSYESKLKKIHDKNYRINDIVNLYNNRIHPLELIVSSQSFQSIETIDKVFSTLLEKSFLTEIQQIKWKFNLEDKKEFSISNHEIKIVKELFKERHQLIHNPRMQYSFTKEEIEVKDVAIFGLIMASDLIFIQFINKNTKDSTKK